MIPGDPVRGRGDAASGEDRPRLAAVEGGRSGALPPPRPKAPAIPLLPDEEIARIVEARHPEPHRVLGPHFAADLSVVAVRAFLPHAATAAVVVAPGKASQPMRRLHQDGLFEAVIAAPEADFAYVLEIVEADARSRRVADPYAFTAIGFAPDDAAAFAAGRHTRLFAKLGAHPLTHGQVQGFMFAVWAPNAERVSVVGSFNRWDGRCHPMRRLPASGVWELFVPDAGEGDLYKYEIRTPRGDVFLRADPFALRTETCPATAGIVSDPDWGFPRGDDVSTRRRRARADTAGIAIHRIDLAAPTGEAPPRTFRELAATAFLSDLKARGFTHVEVAFPPCGAAGASAGYFAPPGAPEDLVAMIDACHQHDLGVIVPTFASALPPAPTDFAWFDGTPLFEGSAATGDAVARFDLERGQIRSMMLSNAMFWLERYRADGWRTDVRTARLLRSLFQLEPKTAADARLIVREPPPPMPDAGRLLTGRCADPHAFLGPHAAGPDGTSLIVRTLRPAAAAVCVCLDDEPEIVWEMSRVHAEGMFAAMVPAMAATAGYTLQIRETSGRTQKILDPYAFPAFVFSDVDEHLFAAGNHYRIYEKLGAHPRAVDGAAGVGFAVWAPNAEGVAVVGPFNAWDGRCHPMQRRGLSGVWELFVPGLAGGELYKFEIKARNGDVFLKSDPYAFLAEVPPGTASIVYDPQDGFAWRDQAWMQTRAEANPWREPIAIYEVHLGSWRRGAGNQPLSYREIGAALIAYVKRMGFTHIELLPIAEHPYEPSWGYQVSNFYAPTSRFGGPHDLMALIDECHRNGIGVILDWVPGHFPKDAHALAWFDGTHLYEHADPRKGEHRDWGTLIFNYGRHEVENFLIANALFWLERFHFDGLRVDAVASMLYLDYSKPNPGDWIPNIHGGRENLEAIEFLKHVNAAVHAKAPGVLMIAEESTAWPGVSRPTDQGGLGFGFKWNMGWMHDVLAYMRTPPEHRRHHHGRLTFGLVYAFDENFILSLSHDEVVHLKGSLLAKMPGDDWEKLANLRLLFGFMYGHPGKKLLFMGGEFGQKAEWSHATSLEWDLAEREPHRQLSRFFADLNRLYRREPALHAADCRAAGFEWLDADNAEDSIIAFVRKAKDPRDALVFVLNFSAVSRPGYRLGVPYPVAYEVIFDSNDAGYGGCGRGPRPEVLTAEDIGHNGRDFSLLLPMPALSAIVLKPRPPAIADVNRLP